MSLNLDHRVRVGAQRRQAMQDRLLICGLKLAAEKSIHEISIDEIISLVGVSRGTFYKYFNSTQNLYSVLAIKIANEAVVFFDSLVPEFSDAAQIVATRTRLALRFVVNNPLLARLLLQIEWPFKDPGMVVFKGFERDIRLGIKQRSFAQVPIDIATSLLIGGVLGAVDVMIKKTSTNSKGYEDKVVFHILLGLGVEPNLAQEYSTMPLPALPDLPITGLMGKIMTLS